MRKRLMAMLLAAAMIASLTATTVFATEDAGEVRKLAVVLNTLSSEYWGYVVAGVKAYDEEHDNVEINIMGPPSETSYDEQLNMIETALGSGIDGLIVSPLQIESVQNLLSSYDIPVVSVNTNLGTSISFVGTGNEEAAKQGGLAAAEAAKAAGWEEIKAINIHGVQGDETHAARMRGFKAGIEEAGGEFLEDEIQYADSVADKAATCMEGIIQTHPEGIACILCNNDDMAMACYRAAQGNEAYANTIFCGFDGIQSACESILAGEETMSVAQDPFGMGYKSCETMMKVLDGEEVEEFVDTGSLIITQENAQEWFDKLKGYLEG